MRGRLEIDEASLAALPEALHVGLLARPGTHPLIARFNSIDTTRGLVIAPRLSLKVQLPDCEIDILTAASLKSTLKNFFTRDATDMDVAAQSPDDR